MENYELYHYGVKGMKWGVRRTAAQLGHVVKKGARKAKTGVESIRAKRAAKKLRNKPIGKLTDAELEQRLKRLELEKRVSDLSKSTKEITAGKQFIETVGKRVVGPAMMDAGKSVLTSFFNKQFKNALGIDVEDTSNIMALLKSTKLEDMNDSQIKKLAKRAEDTDNIKKKLLGQRDNQNQEYDDGTNSSKIAKSKSFDDMTDAEVSRLAKRQESINNIMKSQNKNSDSKNDNDSTSAKAVKGEKWTKSTNSRIDKLLNKKIDELTDTEIAELDKLFKNFN